MKRQPFLLEKNTVKLSVTAGKIIYYMKSFWGYLAIALLFAAVGAFLNVISPRFISSITNEIQQGLSGTMDLDTVVTLAKIYIAILALYFVFTYSQNRIMAKVTQRTAQNMRSDINNKIDRLPLAYFGQNSFGDTLSRVTNDVDTLASTLHDSISTVFSGAVTVIGCVVMMYATNWIMATAGILATLIGFGLTMGIMVKSQPYFIAQQRELGAINGQIEEVFSGHIIVKAFHSENMVAQQFHERNQVLFQNGWKSQFFMSLMMPVMSFAGNLGYVIVCIVGAVLVMMDQVSIGTIVAFMLYIRIFTQPLSSVAQAAGNFQRAAAAGNRIFELLEQQELPDESAKTKQLTQVEGHVDFDHIKFGYDGKNMVIKDFTAQVKAGQKVAIVGPTGAGKTTLINLLMGFYTPNQGRILIDGVPTQGLTRENICHLFSMVLQDTWVFEGSLRDNIIYATQGVSEEKFAEVCNKVGLDHLAKTLPQGYDTVLSESSTLSAGQKQLVTIARAMIENAPLLILDEATSSVDTRTEKMIQQAVDALTQDKTSFVIAHRLSTIRNADVIFVMKDGDIIETGSHDALMEADGFYRQLYNSQFDIAAS